MEHRFYDNRMVHTKNQIFHAINFLYEQCKNYVYVAMYVSARKGSEINQPFLKMRYFINILHCCPIENVWEIW